MFIKQGLRQYINDSKLYNSHGFRVGFVHLCICIDLFRISVWTVACRTVDVGEQRMIMSQYES